ncbi:capsule biosynthesis protein [Paracoccus shanxieyensis]|uniref:Capsule biosynthesis protein CapA n=1 Tax=Paracoccus shanxieyensis TaxID=2675752 RepID=A0A6L6IVE4_9RHOB|nr:capsule biosynthesis protein CapA [Paracoccus shanxieyensis]MTH63591.1 capsule biosynthesis protein CapA [Paracoccus shanxieyensis]MTH86512.1 capsule biosynthesis protein CapA [Paracoccus shanxieyensis]
MLQGPHGPFFDRLAKLLRDAGSTVWRAGFNAGDEHFWTDPAHFIRHTGTPEEWPPRLDALIQEKGVTDIVLYGDVRPIHAAAREAALRYGLVLHVFEEGYLRPFWITYERGGSNGHSALMDIELRDMRNALRGREGEPVNRPPARWGDMRQHKFYGALYHFFVLIANGRYKGYRTHRQIGVFKEFRLNFRRLLMTPIDMLAQQREAAAVRGGGFPYVLVLMQLEHDSNFVAHSPFSRMSEFTDKVLEEFAKSAPRHHRIVFKAHPLEDGRGGIRQAILRKSQELGIVGRVHFVRGGKLAQLLNQARATVTVNSTAAQQALWRGLPVKALGRAVFDKPGLVSDQELADFLADPHPPHAYAYRRYRDFLLESSQVPGGFYSKRSRDHALRLVVDMMLATEDPYQALVAGRGKYRQQLETYTE